ncbi:MAG: hypothetical protein LBH95_06375 [Oscillospiraceae bacterium]|nr:hypothetical protein [Oscillospiraceae bacterium]
MNKRNIYTAIGVALSFLIAIGGWTLTNALIDRKSDVLLSVTGITHNNIYVPPDEPDEDAPAPELSGEEIAAVLRNWENTAIEQFHEPFAGQLTMEQAIEQAKACLASFDGQGVNLAFMLDADMAISPYLCQNLPGGMAFLVPIYSYWTVILYGSDTVVTMKLNAVTGQVWQMRVSRLAAESQFTTSGAYDTLLAYSSYLGLEAGEDRDAGIGRDRIDGRHKIDASISVGDAGLYIWFIGEGRLTSPDSIYAWEFALYLTPDGPFSLYRNYSVDSAEFTS